MGNSRLDAFKWAINWRAGAMGSPKPKVRVVGPFNISAISGLPASLAAKAASEFLTTRTLTSAGIMALRRA